MRLTKAAGTPRGATACSRPPGSWPARTAGAAASRSGHAAGRRDVGGARGRERPVHELRRERGEIRRASAADGAHLQLQAAAAVDGAGGGGGRGGDLDAEQRAGAGELRCARQLRLEDVDLLLQLADSAGEEVRTSKDRW